MTRTDEVPPASDGAVGGRVAGDSSPRAGVRRCVSAGGHTLVSVGLLVSLLLAACSSEEEAAAPEDRRPPTATTTVTVTETVARPAAPPSTGSTNGGAPATSLAFRGNGDRRLPPLRVRRGGTTLSWTNSGEVFSLFSEEGTLVDSVAGEGETYLQAGVHRLDVVASGSWLIRIPRARRSR